ncbi:hypothetical protein SDC9_180688 [bioreactor metagenome]|uniref:Uncharacterized protein n=1 Tax=bioreactor metagenome TaxID=1076179 RepID=A0A645HAR7_9ZZZZ
MSLSNVFGIKHSHESLLYVSIAKVARGRRLIPYPSSKVLKFAYLKDILKTLATHALEPDAAPIQSIS